MLPTRVLHSGRGLSGKVITVTALLLLLIATKSRAFSTADRRRPRLRSETARYIATVSGTQTISIDISEDASRHLSSLHEWSYNCGIEQADFQLAGQEIDGYLDVFLTATSYTPAGSPVLCIPQEVILSATSAREEFGHLEAVENLLQSNGNGDYIPHFYLMLKILVEMGRGTESPYYSYLNSLPRYFSNGVAMTLFCYTCLPPLVAKLCKEERTLFNTLSVAPSLLVPWLSDDIKGDEKLWRWAYQVVQTRGFHTPSGDYCIPPMADFMNHGVDHNVELGFDSYGNCIATTTADVPAGCELKLNYGEDGPSLFLSRYGFLDDGSPTTFCKLIPKKVTEEMEDLGYSHDRMLFYATGDVSEEVFDVLLYILLGEDEAGGAGLQSQFHGAHVSGDFDTKHSMHEQYYHRTMTRLIEHVDEFLASLDELERIANYGAREAIGRYPRLPLILRHNEFVRRIFLAVRAKQAPLVGL